MERSQPARSRRASWTCADARARAHAGRQACARGHTHKHANTYIRTRTHAQTRGRVARAGLRRRVEPTRAGPMHACMDALCMDAWMYAGRYAFTFVSMYASTYAYLAVAAKPACRVVPVKEDCGTVQGREGGGSDRPPTAAVGGQQGKADWVGRGAVGEGGDEEPAVPLRRTVEGEDEAISGERAGGGEGRDHVAVTEEAKRVYLGYWAPVVDGRSTAATLRLGAVARIRKRVTIYWCGPFRARCATVTRFKHNEFESM